MGTWVGHGYCIVILIFYGEATRAGKKERDMYGFCRKPKKNLMQYTYKYMQEYILQEHIRGARTLTPN